MDTRKLSFRLLSALISTVFLLLTAACSSATPTPTWCDGEYRLGRINVVLKQYEDLFSRQPNFVAAVGSMFEDYEGEPIPIVGIKVYVTEKVNQRTLPPEDRIPDCIDGVPIQILSGILEEVM